MARLSSACCDELATGSPEGSATNARGSPPGRDSAAALFRLEPVPPPQSQPQLAAAEDRERERKRRDVVEQAKQQQPGQQLFLVVLPQADQHRGVEYAEAAGRAAGEGRKQ